MLRPPQTVKSLTGNPDVYTDLAQRMHLQGAVKLAVTVRASGDVKSSRPLGGNPLLIEAATTAARKWKFEPA